MKKHQGPTKMRAPSMHQEVACPNSFAEDEGLCLEIDCELCPGPQDLATAKCLSGVILVLASGARPEYIVLKRAVHKRYRAEAAHHACDLARLLGRISRALSNAFTPSDKVCRTCPARRDRVMSFLREQLLRDPLHWGIERQEVGTVVSMLGDVRCDKAVACVSQALASVSVRAEGA